MKKTKGIKLSTAYHVKPKQLRDTLVMTGREYIKTKEYQGEAEKKIENFKKMLQPQLEIFEKMAKQINEQLTSSGILETMEKAEEVYSRFLKSYQPEIRDTFILPRNYSRAIFTDEDIDAISEKAAEKIMEKIKEDSNLRPVIKKPIIEIPPRTTWEDIEIRFKNRYDIEIYIKGKFLKSVSFDMVGFSKEKTKDKEPDKQWIFLEKLSIICENKKIVKADIYSISKQLETSKNNVMKIKEKLSRKLQYIFGLPGDPFCSYKEKGGYQPRFILRPIPTLRGRGDVYMAGARYNDEMKYPDREY
jgi:hypothetical protein